MVDAWLRIAGKISVSFPGKSRVPNTILHTWVITRYISPTSFILDSDLSLEAAVLKNGLHCTLVHQRNSDWRAERRGSGRRTASDSKNGLSSLGDDP